MFALYTPRVLSLRSHIWPIRYDPYRKTRDQYLRHLRPIASVLGAAPLFPVFTVPETYPRDVAAYGSRSEILRTDQGLLDGPSNPVIPVGC